MRSCLRIGFAAAVLVLGASAAAGQPAPARSAFDPTRWGVVMGAPGMEKVRVRADVPYLEDARDTLAIDLYLPPGGARGRLLPAVVFLNAIGDMPGQPRMKEWGIYRTWPRLVAANGMIGISMEAAPDRVPESIRAVFEFLAARGAEYGVDATRLGCYAASANVRQSAAYLLGDSAQAGIRAAVLYYGQPPERAPKRSLPVLFVVAESDAPAMAAPLAELWRRVVDAKAPWELVYASGLPHAFDAVTDDEASRRLVRRTLDFWRAQLEPAPPVDEPPSAARDLAEAMFWNDPARAAAQLEAWLSDHPDQGDAWFHYGRQLVALGRHERADSALVRAEQLGFADAGLHEAFGRLHANRQRWADAADRFERAIAGGARGSQTYGMLAYAQLHLNRNADAVLSYEHAFAAGIPPGPQTRGVAYYNLACAHARLAQKDKALDALASAVENGFTDRAGMESDPDFETLRGEPRWREILARVGAAPAAPAQR